jgi:hypothetical protein
LHAAYLDISIENMARLPLRRMPKERDDAKGTGPNPEPTKTTSTNDRLGKLEGEAFGIDACDRRASRNECLLGVGDHLGGAAQIGGMIGQIVDINDDGTCT